MMVSQTLKAHSSIHPLTLDLVNNNKWLLEVMASLTSKVVITLLVDPYLNFKAKEVTKRQLMCKTFMLCTIRLQLHLSNKLLVATDSQH